MEGQDDQGQQESAISLISSNIESEISLVSLWVRRSQLLDERMVLSTLISAQ